MENQENLLVRKDYLETLMRFKDKQLIKVVTGIRRCGKSTLFDLFINHLESNGVSQKNIIKINFESPDYFELQDWLSVYKYIKEKLSSDSMNYIFLDEIQNVPDFQKAVDGLFIMKNCDIYITGSNAYLLSGELATLLSGRYVEIKMQPLSFKEYLSAYDDKSDLPSKYRKYIQFGSFPYILQLSEEKDIRSYLEGIYNTVVLKNIVARRKIADVGMLEKVIRFMFDNIGNPTSATNIANTMTLTRQKISYHTVENYLSALLDSFIFYKAERYDVKGKQYLSTNAKYYLCDIGLRYYLLGTKPADFGHILENIVFLELLRRGNEVYVGKVDDSEIDFVAIYNGEKTYYQVAYTVIDSDNSEKTLTRELKPLKSVKDNCEKILLTMDNIPPVSYDGIKQKYVLDWLLEKLQRNQN